MAVPHNPVSQVFNHLVAKLHFLPESQVISAGHHGFHQLAQLGLDVYGVDGGVQVTNVSASTQTKKITIKKNGTLQECNHFLTTTTNRRV